jgi:hypothetical protein
LFCFFPFATAFFTFSPRNFSLKLLFIREVYQLATINLIKASFKGRLGQLTGTSWKGKPVVKAAVFSKAPPTNAQTQSVRAFEKLNRIAGAIAKAGFQYLNLSDKKILKHNAVARWLKPAISGHAFDPAKIAQVIPPGADLAYVNYTYNRTSQNHLIGIKLSSQNTPKLGSKVFLLVFDDSAKVAFVDCLDLKSFNLSLSLPFPEYMVYSLIVFTSTPGLKGYEIKNFAYRKAPGMKYSYQEQETGDVWLDGRPIYVRSFNINASFPNPMTLFVDLMDIPGDSMIVSADIHTLGTSFSGNLQVNGPNLNIMASTTTPTLTQPFVSMNVVIERGANKMRLRISSTIYQGGFAGIVTVRYTKYSDSPIDDG